LFLAGQRRLRQGLVVGTGRELPAGGQRGHGR
jgi:hypothetical protein